jgi:L-asparagine oxygenase
MANQPSNRGQLIDGRTLDLRNRDTIALSDLSQKVEHSPYLDHEVFLDQVRALVADLPEPLLAEVEALRNDPGHPGTLLVKGMPLDPIVLGTPAAPATLQFAKRTFVSEFCLVSCGLATGTVFSFREEYGGALVHSIVPRRFLCADTGHFGASNLDFHTEFAWSRIRPEFVLLYCIRNDHDRRARTLVANVGAAAQLLGSKKELLTRPLFRLGAPDSIQHLLQKEDTWTEPVAVLREEPQPTVARVNFTFVQPETHDAGRALRDFHDALSVVARSHQLLPGQLLILDNRRVVHARNSYSPKFDGRDRWVQQVYVRTDLPKDTWLVQATGVPTDSR